MDRASAKKHIPETCGEGWFNLVDMAFDNQPEGVAITEVFQKWAGWKIEFEGENELFEELTDQIYYISQKRCEVCGKSAGYTIIDGWETTLCDEHFLSAEGKEKHRYYSLLRVSQLLPRRKSCKKAERPN